MDGVTGDIEIAHCSKMQVFLEPQLINSCSNGLHLLYTIILCNRQATVSVYSGTDWTSCCHCTSQHLSRAHTMFCSQWMIVPTVFKSLQLKGGSFYRYTSLPSKATHPHSTQPFHKKEGVYTYGQGCVPMDVYLWKGCVPMEGMCTYGKGVYVWKGCVCGVYLSMCTYGSMCTYEKGVYLCNECLYGRGVYL